MTKRVSLQSWVLNWEVPVPACSSSCMMVGNFLQYLQFLVHILYKSCLVQSGQSSFMTSKASLPRWHCQQCPAAFFWQHSNHFKDKFWHFLWHFSVTQQRSVSASQLVDLIASLWSEELKFCHWINTAGKSQGVQTNAQYLMLANTQWELCFKWDFVWHLHISSTARFCSPRSQKSTQEIKNMVSDDCGKCTKPGLSGTVRIVLPTWPLLPWWSLPFLQSFPQNKAFKC